MELPRNFIVEFAGMPKSGKTTVMDVVSHYLRRSSVPVAEFHGGGRYAPLGKDNLARLNLYLACEAVRYCLTTHTAGPFRVHLLDRGLVDRMLFTDALESMGRITHEHSLTIHSLFKAPELQNEIDICFVFSTTPKISLARESANKLTLSTGRVMNDSFLIALRGAALQLQNQRDRPPYIRNLVGVDTAQTDGAVTRTAREVLSRMVGVFKLAGLNLKLPEEGA